VTPIIKHPIIAFNCGNQAISMSPSTTPTVINSNIYGNERGDWVGVIADQVHWDGNISGNPCFCSVDDGSYGLCADSPCRPENNPGGEELMGFVVQGCSACGCSPPFPREKKSMGSLKGMFR